MWTVKIYVSCCVLFYPIDTPNVLLETGILDRTTVAGVRK